MLLVLMLTLTAVWYGPMRDNGYVYEDVETIDASMARGQELSQHPSSALQLGLDTGRVSIWATAQAFGNTPLQHHRMNLALHLVNGLLLAALLMALGVSTWGWVLGATLFLTHSIQTEAVALVASRSELLSSLFMLAALLVAVVKPLNLWRSVVVLGLGCLAMMSKQDAVLLWIFLPLLAMQSRKRYIYSIVATWALCAGAGAWWMATRGEAMALPYYGLTYAAYQSTALWNLFTMVVWPFGRLNIDHDIGVTPTLLVYLSLVLSAAVVMIGTKLRQERSLFGVALLWPFIVLLPRVVIRVPEFFNEHQFYFAFVGVSLLVALAFTPMQQRMVV